MTGSIGTATTPFQYAGQCTDSESGLQYLRTRYYDPQTAQFLTVDPLVGVTQQPYGYAGDNPEYWADPSGLGCGLAFIPCPGILQKAGTVVGAAAAWVGSALTAKQRTEPPAVVGAGAVFTAEGVREIVRHLARLDGGLDDPANQQMLARMDEILAGVREPCAEDANWYNHELYESALIDQNAEWRADPNAAWRAAHDQTLADQNMTAEDVYPRDVVEAHADAFSTRIKQYWGLTPPEEDPR